jgi:hypothetical protein
MKSPRLASTTRRRRIGVVRLNISDSLFYRPAAASTKWWNRGASGHRASAT